MLALLFLTLLSAQDPPPAPPADGSRLVRIELVADRDAIHPGERFQLGVHLGIEPRWHIYWENPGDSGLATSAKLDAPSGFTVGPVRHPAPERLELEGDIISYVHHGDVLLLADVAAPESAAVGSTVRFAVESRWLVCTDVCFAGSGKAGLELAVVEKTRATKPAHEKLFAGARARMPRPWNEIAPSVDVTGAGDDATPVQKLRVRGATALEFFPYASTTTLLTSRSVKIGPAGGTLEVVWRFDPKAPPDRPEMRGLLHVRTAQGEAFYSFDPHPGADTTPEATPGERTR